LIIVQYVLLAYVQDLKTGQYSISTSTDVPCAITLPCYSSPSREITSVSSFLQILGCFLKKLKILDVFEGERKTEYSFGATSSRDFLSRFSHWTKFMAQSLRRFRCFSAEICGTCSGSESRQMAHLVRPTSSASGLTGRLLLIIGSISGRSVHTALLIFRLLFLLFLHLGEQKPRSCTPEAPRPECDPPCRRPRSSNATDTACATRSPRPP